VRRSWPQVLDRLGLDNFSWTSVAVGFGVALLLILVVYVVSIIWFLIVGQETFEEQNEASDAIAESINTLWLALGVSVTAAIGEEIAFRGALQPIFGLWWTAIFFTLVHMQYTLTPAAFIILVVAIGLGWLRRRYNLYAAIAAHFLYNFIPLALSVLIES
jgi:membrane protease YdiL (CAAX protease family)